MGTRDWSDVTSDPKYQALTPEARAAVRDDYFSQVLAPAIDTDTLAAEQTAWRAKTDRDVSGPGILERAAALLPNPAATATAVEGLQLTPRHLVGRGLGGGKMAPPPDPLTADHKPFTDADVAAYRAGSPRVTSQPNTDRISNTPISTTMGLELNKQLGGSVAGNLVTGAVAGLGGLGEIIPGLVAQGADLVGADGVSEFARGAASHAQAFQSGAGGVDPSIAFQIGSSVVQSLPTIAAAVGSGGESLLSPAMRVLFAQSYGQNYAQGRNSGLDAPTAAVRSAWQSAFEVLGERFGLPEQVTILKGVLRGMPNAQMAATAGRMTLKELLGEELTTAGQFVGDKFGPGGLNPNATLDDYLRQATQTAQVTLGQSALMGGGPLALRHAGRVVASADRSIDRAPGTPVIEQPEAGFNAADYLSPTPRPAATPSQAQLILNEKWGPRSGAGVLQKAAAATAAATLPATDIPTDANAVLDGNTTSKPPTPEIKKVAPEQLAATYRNAVKVAAEGRNYTPGFLVEKLGVTPAIAQEMVLAMNERGDIPTGQASYLPSPNSATGVLRADAVGNVTPETNAQAQEAKAARATQLAAEARKVELGATPDVEAATSQRAASQSAETNAAIREQALAKPQTQAPGVQPTAERTLAKTAEDAAVQRAADAKPEELEAIAAAYRAASQPVPGALQRELKRIQPLVKAEPKLSLDETAQAERSIPEYGEAQPGAISVVGVHYSHEPRTELHGDRYGSGYAGAERGRLEGESDLARRTYFYVDEGRGVKPEAGVGGVAHRVRLNNIYDPRTHLLDRPANDNEFERRVIDAGFDGYYAPGAYGKQGGVVLLGQERPVPVAAEVRSRRGEVGIPIPQLSVKDVNQLRIDVPSLRIKNGVAYSSPNHEAVLRAALEKLNESQQTGLQQGGVAGDAAEAGGRQPGVDGAVRADPGAPSGPPLSGLPTAVVVDGRTVTFGPNFTARSAAQEYMKGAGLAYAPPTRYVKVDGGRAKRLADAFEAMPHAPDDPDVAAAYEALIKETLAQYQAVKAAGLKVEFIRGPDPYGNPRHVLLDVRDNNHMWVFPTDDGFGGGASADVNVAGNPLLRLTDETISGQRARVNDIFRVVHDYFGHVKEGVGFRAEGEENAWQSHRAMYSPLAARAMTTETRGQNSWVNYGPYAEANKTASPADTEYAPQKIGLLPEWASDEGYVGGGVTGKTAFKQWFGESKVVDKVGKPLVVYHGTGADIETFDPKLRPDRRSFVSKMHDAMSNIGLLPSRGRFKNDSLDSSVFGNRLEAAERLYGGPLPPLDALDSNVVFFTDNKNLANEYAQVYGSTKTGGEKAADAAPNVIPVFLKIEHPVIMDFSNEKDGLEVTLPNGEIVNLGQTAIGSWDTANRIGLALAKKYGADGVILRNVFDSPIPKMRYESHEKAGVAHSDIQVVFRSDQIKSAIGNSNFDAGSDDIRLSIDESSANAGLNRRQAAVSLIQDLYAPFALSPQKLATVGDVAQFLQDRALKALGAPITENTATNRRFLSRVITAEAREALGRQGNAGQWYKKSLADAVDGIAELHPEVRTDVDSRFIWQFALALTSNGQAVPENVRLAAEAYDSFKRSGVFPSWINGGGKNAHSIRDAFAYANSMIQEIGVPAFRTAMLRTWNARELQEWSGRELRHQFADSTVYGGAIFGPKIGGAFLQNLNGNFDALTIDRWMMRTWGRLTGNLVDKASETGVIDVPSGASQRKFISDTMAQALDNLRAAGTQLDMADLQAAIWYPEKELYGRLGRQNTRSAPTDYATEVAKYVGGRADRGAQPGGGQPAVADERTAGVQEALFSLGDRNEDASTPSPQPAGEAPVENRAAAAALQERFARDIPGFVLDAVPAPDGARIHGIDALSTALGRDVMWVDQPALHLFNGLYSEQYPNKIIIDRNSTRPMAAVFGHEFVHSLAAGNTEDYNRLVDALLPLIHNERDRYDAINKRRAENNLKPLDGSNQLEELIADIVGDRFTEPEFWTLVASKVAEPKSVLRRVLDTIKQLISKITQVRPFGTERYLTDLRAARQAVADVLATYIDGQGEQHGNETAAQGTDQTAAGSENPTSAGDGDVRQAEAQALTPSLSVDEEKKSGLRERFVQRVDNAVNAIGEMPDRESYMTERYLTLGRIGRADKLSSDARKALRNGSDADRKAVYAYLTDAHGKPGAITDPGVRSAALQVKALLGSISDNLVQRGLISQETREEYRDAYLPRVYLKYLDSDGYDFGRGKKVSDLGNLKARKDIPEDVRRVMLGEIKDAPFLASLAISRPLRDMALLDFMGKIASHDQWTLPHQLVEVRPGVRATPQWLQAEAKWLRRRADFPSPADAAAARQKADEYDRLAKQALDQIEATWGLNEKDTSKFKRVPDTPRYGMLRGMMVRKEIHDDLVGAFHVQPGDLTFVESMLGYGGVGTRLQQLFKVSKVTLNPPSQVRNIVSNAVMLQLSGVSMGMVPIRLLQAAMDMRADGPVITAARKYGLTEATFAGTELPEAKTEMIRALLDDGGISHVRKLGLVANWLGRSIVEGAGHAYQYFETLFKVAKMKDELASGAPEWQAALEAHKWLYDYTDVDPNIKYARNVPLGAPFATWATKTAPRLLEVAMLHPHRFLPWVALWYGLPYLWAAAGLGADPDDIEKMKKVLPEWMRKKAHIAALPIRDSEGRMQVMDLGPFFPWTMYADMLQGARNGSLVDAVAPLAGQMFGGPVADTVSMMKTGVDPFTQKPVADKGDPLEMQFWSWANYAYNEMAPSFLTSQGVVSPFWLADEQMGGKLAQAVTGNTDKFGNERATMGQAMSRLLGANVYGVNPENSRAQQLLKYTQDVQDARQRLVMKMQDRSLTEEQRQRLVSAYSDEMRKRGEKLRAFSDLEVPEPVKQQK